MTTLSIKAGAAGASTGVRSYIYVLEGDKFKLIWQADDIFIRKIENGIIAQSFSAGEGFEGKMYSIDYADGHFKNGAEVKLPQGVNIYDFQYVYAPDGRRALFAWSDNGVLNFYNDKGIRTWVSKEDFGGFADAYKKESGNLMIEKGSWTLKDRLVANNAEVLAPKRKSMFNFRQEPRLFLRRTQELLVERDLGGRDELSRRDWRKHPRLYSDRRQASRSGQTVHAEQCQGLAERSEPHRESISTSFRPRADNLETALSAHDFKK